MVAQVKNCKFASLRSPYTGATFTNLLEYGSLKQFQYWARQSNFGITIFSSQDIAKLF